MRARLSTVGWRATLAGVAVVGVGVGAILAASIQGMELQPGGTLIDGYWVGLLPWMDVGTWLVPIGGVVAIIGAFAVIWTRGGTLVRVVSLVPLVAVLFWGLVAGLAMAPHSAVPDVPPKPSSLATFVYSRPADTIWFLLVPAVLAIGLAWIGRRRAA